MTTNDERSPIPGDFSGIVRIFPLPNLVLFPHVAQPLHIFEPRYCEMLEDAMADDQLIAMALLEPGWQNDYEGRPAIAPVACLGQVISHAQVEGAKHNIILRGVCRVEIERELPPVRSFRQAKVNLIEDQFTEDDATRNDLRRRLVEAFRRYVTTASMLHAEFDEILEKQVPLDVITDVVAYSLQTDPAFKQQILNETNVEQRATTLIDVLEMTTTHFERQKDSTFPPDFSAN